MLEPAGAKEHVGDVTVRRVGAMTVGILRLPITAVLVTTVFYGTDGVTLMALVIVAVVVSYVASARLPEPASRGDGAAPAEVQADRATVATQAG